MSGPKQLTRASAAARPASPVPDRARALAAQLAVLFERDREIVGRLGAAQQQLAAANDRLVCRSSALPGALHDVHWQLHRAFCAYQSACEQRRQLAVDVGELSALLTGALTAAGYSSQQARSANVHRLAAGTWQATGDQQESGR
ncbi:MAG TPA: hypothetical protein VED41_06020 [Solirubrobacteraceae bacterium]|nr:hypothetical protein [Solirubrobacteraceae bacterium]